MISTVVISIKFSIHQCLHYFSSMHGLSTSVKGSRLFLNRFPCSTPVTLREMSNAKELVKEFRDVIAVADDDLGHTSLLYPGDEQPICPDSGAYLSTNIQKLLHDMLGRGTVEHPYSKKIRFCI